MKEVMMRDAGKVPAYPEGDAFRSVHRWPMQRTFDGQIYGLMFFGRKHDFVVSDKSRLEDIEPGWDYGARYVRHTQRGKQVSRGPWYSWRSDSSLAVRIYVTASSLESWSYDSTGSLLEYAFQRHQPKDGEALDIRHYFGLDGRLVGLRAFHRAYWMGKETVDKEFIGKVLEFNRAHRKPSAR